MAQVRLFDSISVGVASLGRGEVTARELVSALAVGRTAIARGAVAGRDLLTAVSAGKAAPEDLKDFSYQNIYEL